MANEAQGRILKRYRVNGPYAGKDCVLAGFVFTAGECVIERSAQEHASLARLFWYYQAEEVADDGQRNVEANQAGSLEREVRPEGIGAAPGATESGQAVGHVQAEAVDQGRRLVSSWDGPADGVEELRAALRGLDRDNDSHWTSSGKPSIASVEAAAGHAVTRAQIEAALPGFSRKGQPWR